jgi:hypothetical protein
LWFDPNQGTRENKFGMVEVKHAHRLCGSFNIDPDLALNSLLGNANDVTVPEQRKQTKEKET